MQAQAQSFIALGLCIASVATALAGWRDFRRTQRAHPRVEQPSRISIRLVRLKPDPNRVPLFHQSFQRQGSV